MSSRDNLDSDWVAAENSKAKEALDKARLNNALGDSSPASQNTVGPLRAQAFSDDLLAQQLSAQVQAEEERLRLMKENPPEEEGNSNIPHVEASEALNPFQITPRSLKE